MLFNVRARNEKNVFSALQKNRKFCTKLFLRLYLSSFFSFFFSLLSVLCGFARTKQKCIVKMTANIDLIVSIKENIEWINSRKTALKKEYIWWKRRSNSSHICANCKQNDIWVSFYFLVVFSFSSFFFGALVIRVFFSSAVQISLLAIKIKCTLFVGILFFFFHFSVICIRIKSA